jgi:hypothetical protein
MNPALANDNSHAELLDDVGLVWLFADAGCGTGGGNGPPASACRLRRGRILFLLLDHWSAVIKDGAVQIDLWVVFHQVRVDGVTTRIHPA